MQPRPCFLFFPRMQHWSFSVMFVHSNGLETLLGRITAQRVISRMVGQRPPLLPPRLVSSEQCLSWGQRSLWGTGETGDGATVPAAALWCARLSHSWNGSILLHIDWKKVLPGKSFFNVYSSWYSPLLNVSDFWNRMQNYPLNDCREVECYSYSNLGWLSFSCLQLYDFISAKSDLAALVSNEDKTHTNWRHTVSAAKIYIHRL